MVRMMLDMPVSTVRSLFGYSPCGEMFWVGLQESIRMGKFYEKLKNRWQSTESLLCVGLDPHPRYLLKEKYPKSELPYLDFSREVIDATAEFACAFKFQFACFGGQGMEEDLEQAVNHVRTNHPDIPVILDSKRGDIGSTAVEYAEEAFTRYGADALTVNPYLGGDCIEVFADYSDRGVIVLCRTSNPGSAELQELQCGDRMLYEHVAHLATGKWNKNNNISLVMGATHPETLAKVRVMVGNMPFLVPGIGAQGGNLEAVLKHGLTESGYGLMINVSRGIAEAGWREGRDLDFQAVHDAARYYFDLIRTTKSEMS